MLKFTLDDFKIGDTSDNIRKYLFELGFGSIYIGCIGEDDYGLIVGWNAGNVKLLLGRNARVAPYTLREIICLE